jgi:ribosomal protein RSM22 (predicted rRNA methylase)
MSLPGPFQGAIAAWLEAHASGGRREGSAALSATYRAGRTSGSIDLASYLVARLPATYAAVSRVLAEAAALRPGFSPGSLLDAGSGPGTASWAAAAVWPALERINFLDNMPEFLRLAAGLASGGPGPLANARAVPGSIEALPDDVHADLVIAAYALAELGLARIGAAAAKLWAASRSMLVIVEPGTPAGFARIRAAREALLKLGAVPVAPCTHSVACPITGEDWCHFSVRLARSRAHMHAKGASVPFEDERFCYLVLSREGEPSGLARIVAPPLHAKPGSTFRVCTQGRLEARYVARREKAAYKHARKLEWGGVIGPAAEEEDGP